jgi:hypothetical protein
MSTRYTVAGHRFAAAELAEMSMSALVEIHNSLNKTSPVQRFRSVQDGVRTIKALLVKEMRGRIRKNRPMIRKTAVVSLVARENPKKPGTEAYKRFQRYRDGMTVGEAMRAGIMRDDIRYDIRRNFIAIRANNHNPGVHAH